MHCYNLAQGITTRPEGRVPAVHHQQVPPAPLRDALQTAHCSQHRSGGSGDQGAAACHILAGEV